MLPTTGDRAKVPVISPECCVPAARRTREQLLTLLSLLKDMMRNAEGEAPKARTGRMRVLGVCPVGRGCVTLLVGIVTSLEAPWTPTTGIVWRRVHVSVLNY